MDVLERNNIAIDMFHPLFPSKCLFLLTHVHLDHLTVSKRFPYEVYASSMVDGLVDLSCVRAILTPGEWYTLNNVDFLVIKTRHTYESIGFYFPLLRVFYIGDGMVDIVPDNIRQDAPLCVVYDGMFSHYDREMGDVCRYVNELLTSGRYSTVCIKHHGFLSFLLDDCGMKFKLGHDLSPLSMIVANKLDMVDETSKFTLVGVPTMGSSIILSSLWFYQLENGCKDHCQIDGPNIRIFCSMHALKSDIDRLRNRLPFAILEKLPLSGSW